MYPRCFLFIILFCGVILCSIKLHAQEDLHNTSEKKGKLHSETKLFDNDDIIHFTLKGKLNELFNDRNAGMAYHPLLLEYRRKDSSLVSIQITAKTRGHFRRLKANCKMPPLLLNLPKSDKLKNSVFEKQQKLKLVVPCQGDDYVIKEWLVYKLYNTLTEKSFRAKLVQVDFEDSSNRRKTETHYCILIEDENTMAERNKTFVWKRKMLGMKDIDKDEFRNMAVFQYMIGNTDWGVMFLQNIVLITKDSTIAPLAIPYDFDHAGIVDAAYAGPAEELEISSNRERLYRGFCEKDMNIFAKTIDLFNNRKNDIYNVYDNCSLLKPKYVKFVKNYLDDFYKIINSHRELESEFGKPCRTNVRVEMKGLKK